jgi:hypothetical protein
MECVFLNSRAFLCRRVERGNSVRVETIDHYPSGVKPPKDDIDTGSPDTSFASHVETELEGSEMQTAQRVLSVRRS